MQTLNPIMWSKPSQKVIKARTSNNINVFVVMALMLLMCGLLWVLLCLVCSTTATDCEDKSPSWYNSVSVYTSWAFWASPDLCSISLIGSWLSLTATSKPLVLLHKGMPLDQDTVKEAFLFWENANCKGKKHRLKSMRADNSEKKSEGLQLWHIPPSATLWVTLIQTSL